MMNEEAKNGTEDNESNKLDNQENSKSFFNPQSHNVQLTDQEINQAIVDYIKNREGIPSDVNIEIENVTRHKNAQVIRTVQHESRSFSGPLPPPDVLAEYEQAVPGSGQKIVTQFLAEGDHRRELENREQKLYETGLEYDFKHKRLGQIFSIISILIFSIVAMFFAWVGQPVEGVAVLIGAIVSLVAIFVYGQRKSKEPETPKEETTSDGQSLQNTDK